jgi:hypothetical protein
MLRISMLAYILRTLLKVPIRIVREFSGGENSVFRAREDQRKVIQAASGTHKTEQLLSQT